ncbi:MAG TPA: branched-chain amino acid transporter AzlD [Acidimicrobiaceae bacterium]|nr:branched-chain amino acid transporter AzlD [Acidimicrobiaceae bacterium]HCB37964.1 branched-chain amino acid transporter AzlD [Acidimicrobiaceae bacterium]
MLTWAVVGALAVGVYGQRLAGMMLVDVGTLGRRTAAVLAAVPPAIVCAVAAQQTFVTGGQLALDARVLGVGAAVVCAWRRLPVFVTVIVAAAVTALVRLVA